VLKPAEQTPASILVLIELIGELFPAGVVNIVNGFGKEAGEALATSKRIAKIAFTGSTPVGQRILHAAADNLIPSTVELGGKSPNIFFADVLDKDDAFLDKALEGLAMFSLNQGEVCTCPSRVLIQESIYEEFIARAVARVERIKAGHPLDMQTMIGAQASQQQLDKILSYIDIGRSEGAHCLTGGRMGGASYRPRQRLLRKADDAIWRQHDACVPGRDLWPRGVGHDLQGRAGSSGNRQRYILWARRRGVVAKRNARLPHGA
jgi:aldehyde dehydrogenase